MWFVYLRTWECSSNVQELGINIVVGDLGLEEQVEMGVCDLVFGVVGGG